MLQFGEGPPVWSTAPNCATRGRSNVCIRLRSLVLACACALLVLACVPSSHAALTLFSRANCINNESITWDPFFGSYWLWTYSWHWQYGVYQHNLATGWEYTWRSAAIHWGEGFSGGWLVQGGHWMWVSGYGNLYLGTTSATNCNLL